MKPGPEFAKAYEKAQRSYVHRFAKAQGKLQNLIQALQPASTDPRLLAEIEVLTFEASVEISKRIWGEGNKALPLPEGQKEITQ